jgi:RimJ/RimL family protein N-acetyltransferase
MPQFQARPGDGSERGSAAARRPIVLETDRLKLRSLRPSDASRRYLKWIADPEVMTPLNMPARELNLGELAAYIASFDDRQRYLVGIFEKEGDRHIGILMVEVNSQHRLAKLSFLIGEADWRGKGALREAGAALIAHLFAERSIEKIKAQAMADNTASQATLEALGFQAEGLMPGEVRSFVDGTRLDQYLYGLLLRNDN